MANYEGKYEAEIKLADDFKEKTTLVDLYDDMYPEDKGKVIPTEILPKTPLKNPIRPEYYGGEDNPFEVRKIIKAYDLDFFEGNVVKYILRYRGKDGMKDLKKCKQYLEFVIENYENELRERAKI